VPKSDGGNPRFTVTLPSGIIARLDEIAQARGSKRASLIREAVFAWLQRSEQQRQAS
jgi:predicted transcriptional regulator